MLETHKEQSFTMGLPAADHVEPMLSSRS